MTNHIGHNYLIVYINWHTFKCNSKYLVAALAFANRLQMIWKNENMLSVEEESAYVHHVKEWVYFIQLI